MLMLSLPNYTMQISKHAYRFLIGQPACEIWKIQIENLKILKLSLKLLILFWYHIVEDAQFIVRQSSRAKKQRKYIIDRIQNANILYWWALIFWVLRNRSGNPHHSSLVTT